MSSPQPTPDDELFRLASIVCPQDRGEKPFAWNEATDHPAPDDRTVRQIHALADDFDDEAGPDAPHPLAARLRGLLRRRRDGQR